MFKNSKVFSGFSVNDTKKAKDFYSQVLGLDVMERGDALSLQIKGSNEIFIYPKPNHIPATFTILNFPTKDIDKTVEELKKRGVQFENYKEETFKTDDMGIHRDKGMSIAWFKDPAGNILSVIETD